MNRFQKHYENIVCYDLLFKDYFINVMQLPKVDQITINTGIGLGAVLDKRRILTALLGLELVSGQRPEITRAKKSIDKFKLREKMPIGCKVTLRNKPLHIFIDRLVNTVLPSVLGETGKGNSGIYKKSTKFMVESLSGSLNKGKEKRQIKEAEQNNDLAKWNLAGRRFRASPNINLAPHAEESISSTRSGLSSAVNKFSSAQKGISLAHVEQIAAFLVKHKHFPARGRDYFLLSRVCSSYEAKDQASFNFLLDHNFISNRETRRPSFFKSFFLNPSKKTPQLLPPKVAAFKYPVANLPLFTKKTVACIDAEHRHLHRPLQTKQRRIVVPTLKKEHKKISERYSISFGIGNVAVFALASLANFEVSHPHGLDIIFGVRQRRCPGGHLSKPQYLLSSFQMPFL